MAIACPSSGLKQWIHLLYHIHCDLGSNTLLVPHFLIWEILKVCLELTIKYNPWHMSNIVLHDSLLFNLIINSVINMFFFFIDISIPCDFFNNSVMPLYDIYYTKLPSCSTFIFSNLFLCTCIDLF